MVHKITSNTDDTGFFLSESNPIQSYTALRSTLVGFAKVSGHRINKSKSAVMGISVSTEIKRDILTISQAVWCEKFRCLGVIMLNSVIAKEWLDSKFGPLINDVANQLVYHGLGSLQP